MIFSLFLACFLLPFSSCSDGKGKVSLPSSSTGSTISLQERVEKMLELSSRRPIVKLNDKLFKDLVRGGPRNYSVIVMFTALSSHRGCAICGQASDEFTLVGNSYRYSQFYSNKMFFGLVDFDEGGEIFQALGLNSAPAFIHFPPKGKPKKQDHMDLQRVGFSAEAIARWIIERTEINIRVFRPPNYTGTMALLSLFGMVGFLVYLRRNNLEFLLNKNTWCVVAMFFVLSMISGQMWNHIRGPPFVHNSQSGGVAYIHGSSQGQFVLETYFVMGMYGMIVMGVILLCEAGDEKVDPGFRRIQAVAGMCLVAFFYSLVLSVFRSKAGGYPYSFLFK